MWDDINPLPFSSNRQAGDIDGARYDGTNRPLYRMNRILSVVHKHDRQDPIHSVSFSDTPRPGSPLGQPLETPVRSVGESLPLQKCIVSEHLDTASLVSMSTMNSEVHDALFDAASTMPRPAMSASWDTQW